MEIARALGTDARVLLLDEPTAALDPESERRVLRIIADLPRATTVVMVSHNAATFSGFDQVFACESRRLRVVPSAAVMAAR